MKGNSGPQPVSTKQARIAELAKQMPDKALYSLSRYLDLDWCREAYHRTRKGGAVGIDGQTADEYALGFDARVQDLLERIKSGSYRAPAVRRVHIPKGNGKTRPIGIPTFEDKVAQRAVLMLLEPLYEQDFYDFSYGFRPGRSAHDALDALDAALLRVGGGWVLEVDIASFFDSLDHEKLQGILRQRVTDGVIVRMIGKWLNAGVMEGGVMHRVAQGTPQGGVISPLLANVYLHEVLDRWWVEQVLPRMSGQAYLIRYADDFVMVFSDQVDAVRVQEVLPKRFSAYGLTLHPDKTRLLYYRRPSPDGLGTPPKSFDFLGFTHFWGTSRRGKPVLKRKTAKDRFARAGRAINAWLRRARHRPIDEQAQSLSRKLRGHFNYYGRRGNSRMLSAFRSVVTRLWFRWLRRRSQRTSVTWKRFAQHFRHLLPPARLPSRAWAVAGEPMT